MMRRLIAAATLALVAALAPAAQTPDPVHTFEVRDGQVYLDGRHLPDAVPPEIDLTGYGMEGPLEYSGPIVPTLEVDGVVYVLEGERLVALASTSRPDRGVYILSDVTPEPPSFREMPAEQVDALVEAAYMEDVAASDESLMNRLQQERAMDAQVDRLATRIRSLPVGAERAQLRTQLRSLLSDLLSLKHEIRAEEIRVATERLDAAREGLDARRSHHDDIVDGRLRELVGGE